MLINCGYLHLNLLIFAFLIHFSNSNCNWLRIGISEIRLPQSDYIKQFNPRQSRASQSRKMNHSNNENSHPHRKPSVNNSIAKYFDYSNGEDTFLNDVTGSAQSPDAVRQLEEYDAILSQFSSAQLKFIKRNPNSLGVLSEGTSLAIQQCAERFSKERWNCSIEDENELFAQTLRRGNRESAFLQAIVSAGITYSLTQACSRGHLENCACDYSQYERFSDIELARKQNTNQRVWHWAGCSDNLAFGIRLAKRFLDASVREASVSAAPSKRRAGLKEMMTLHNHKAGREAIKKLMRLKCRCHGSSGSCQLKTCWRVLPNFDEIGKYLKKKYLQSVRIQGIVNHGSTFGLKRSRRASDLLANELSDQPSLSTELSKSTDATTTRLEESTVFDSKFKDRKIGSSRLADETSPASRSRRSVQQTNRVVSSQFNGIELGSNSFIVNKLNEKEIDQDDDYEDYVENDLQEELEQSKLTAETSGATNRVFSGKQSRQVTSRQSAEDKQVNARQVNKSESSNKQTGSAHIDNEPTGRRTVVGGQPELNSNRIDKQKLSAKTARTNRKQATRQATDKQATNKQMSGPSNRQPSSKQPIGNEQFNGLGIEIENMIRNVVSSSSDDQQASSLDASAGVFRSPGKQELVYAYDSPNYCTASSYLKILGTVNRSCRKVKRKHSDSCDSLCCGRGYDKRIVHKSEECQCEFDAVSVGVKCKTCEFALETFTCK